MLPIFSVPAKGKNLANNRVNKQIPSLASCIPQCAISPNCCSKKRKGYVQAFIQFLTTLEALDSSEEVFFLTSERFFLAYHLPPRFLNQNHLHTSCDRSIILKRALSLSYFEVRSFWEHPCLSCSESFVNATPVRLSCAECFLNATLVRLSCAECFVNATLVSPRYVSSKTSHRPPQTHRQCSWLQLPRCPHFPLYNCPLYYLMSITLSLKSLLRRTTLYRMIPIPCMTSIASIVIPDFNLKPSKYLLHKQSLQLQNL